MSSDVHMPLGLDEIIIPAGRRELNKAEVAKLAKSIDEIGLRHPVTVRKKGDEYILVAGRHRVEAFRKLGKEHIPAIICTFTNIDAKMWEIAENLHRADLTTNERAIQIADWVRLSDEKRVSSQVATKSAGRPESGERAAARELGLTKDAVNRAVKIAGISEEANEAAKAAGLDDNQSALLEVAKEPTPERQVAKVVQLRDRGKVSTWRDDFERLWRRGTDDDHAWARDHMDAPIMDGKFA